MDYFYSVVQFDFTIYQMLLMAQEKLQMNNKKMGTGEMLL